MQITEELLERGKSDRGGWNREQLKIIGVDWPPAYGWKSRVIGKQIAGDHARQFLALRGVRFRRGNRRSVVKTDLPIPVGFHVNVETVLASFWIFLSKLDPDMKRKVAPILEYMLRKLNQ